MSAVRNVHPNIPVSALSWSVDSLSTAPMTYPYAIVVLCSFGLIINYGLQNYPQYMTAEGLVQPAHFTWLVHDYLANGGTRGLSCVAQMIFRADGSVRKCESFGAQLSVFRC